MMLQDMKVMLSDLWHWLAQDAEYVLRNSRNHNMRRLLGR